MVTDDELLQSLIKWVQDQVAIHRANPLDDRQAEAIGKLFMPALNRKEYLLVREFVDLGKSGMGPCLREDVALLIAKLLDEQPVGE